MQTKNHSSSSHYSRCRMVKCTI